MAAKMFLVFLEGTCGAIKTQPVTPTVPTALPPSLLADVHTAAWSLVASSGGAGTNSPGEGSL